MAFGNSRQPQNRPYGDQQFNQPYENPQYFQSQQPRNFQQGYAAQTPVMDAQAVYTQDSYQRAARVSVTKAYAEMTAGLLVTAVAAVVTQASGLLYSFLMTTGMLGWIGLSIVQVVMAVALSAKVMSMNPATARVVFYIYAALMGFTLSSIFAVYSLGSIVMVLAMTAGFFLCLTMLGLTTKIDMLRFGPILMVALIVLIVAEILMAIFLPGQTMTMVCSAIALVIFAGLTAHDAQFTRAMFQQYSYDGTMIRRVSILCALNLYLDFINFFINLLQLFGSRD
ncbi:BAX inhibitor (BI)-1/YccA family protein [Bifidobacterium sp. SMB2]|uniref:BAX inhibitor (BI)-1/YccA family protein n=1 Tax=Bifidobacterium saimiriisciurei TaxID=2661627 RepID=A0ABX0CAL2_9BIFI|nr:MULTISPECIES: Bax inhibitor-1/YccA family protein [Bifidobacterium]NEG95812.1 BAX inhibitor (BI)-1/YccA family protein [Bifidobacterium sp. SMB2]NEH11239.1 BAX inhibitor (BI)-1/YccA family protein [Bifidobacterium saimiriisciurei]